MFAVLAGATGCTSGPDLSGPAPCPEDLAFFTEHVYRPILANTCIQCHRAGGPAGASRLVVVRGEDPMTLEHNFRVARAVAQSTVGGQSVLRLRPTGRFPGGHPGGTLFSPTSTEAAAIDEFTRRMQNPSCTQATDRTDGGLACTGEPPPGEPLIRRLSRDEYDATLRDLFGLDDLAYGAQLPADVVVDGFDNHAASLEVTPLFAEQLDRAADAIAARALREARTRVIRCRVGAPLDESCAQASITAFGARAYRRPLGDDEVARYMSLFRVASAGSGGFDAGMQRVVQTMLVSPGFLYRTELGGAPDVRGRVHLDAYELASELSYLVWGSMPDDALFEAARTGALDTPAGRVTQARRLLVSPRSRAQLHRFVHQWLETDRLDTVAKDPATYPELDRTVRAAMRDELEHFVDDVMSGDATLDALLTQPVRPTGALAALYGGQPDGARVGVLGLGAVLTVHARPSSSSPVLRGKLVRERFFCQPLPPPPAGVVTDLPNVDPTLRTRERFAAHATNAVCASCHELMDPIGFGFEHFDGLGRWRATEAGQPIDVTGDVRATAQTDGAFDGAAALARKLARSREVSGCFTRQWVRFGYGVSEDAPRMSCTARALAARFEASGHSIAELIVALVEQPHFVERVAAPASTPPPTPAGAPDGGLPR